MQELNGDRLAMVIQRAEQTNMDGKLDISLILAKEFLIQLRHLETIRGTITRPGTEEMRALGKPPEIMKSVITATLIILGEEESKMRVSKDPVKTPWSCIM